MHKFMLQLLVSQKMQLRKGSLGNDLVLSRLTLSVLALFKLINALTTKQDTIRNI